MARKVEKLLLHSETVPLCGRGVEYQMLSYKQRSAGRRLAAEDVGHYGRTPDNKPDPDAIEEFTEAVNRRLLLTFIKRVTKTEGMTKTEELDALPETDWVPFSEALLDEYFDGVTDYDALLKLAGTVNGLTDEEFKAVMGKPPAASAASAARSGKPSGSTG